MSLTPGDIKYLVHAWKCIETPKGLNLEKLAEETGGNNSKSAGNGYRNAIKKLNDGATLPAVGLATPNGKKAADPSTGAAPKAAVSGIRNPRATPRKARIKNEDLIASKADSIDSDPDNTTGNDDGAEADVDTPISTATPAANAAKKRVRKATAAPELDDEGNPITPTAKRARVTKASELDANDQPISTPKGGRKPKTDTDGNAIKPAPRIRKPKEQLDENGNVKPVRTRKAPVPKLDENGNEIPVNKGGRKSKAKIEADAKAKADMEALIDKTEADEQQEDEHLASTVLSVFEHKEVVHEDEDEDLPNAAVSVSKQKGLVQENGTEEGTLVLMQKVMKDTIVVKEEAASGGSDGAEMLGDVDEDEVDTQVAPQPHSDGSEEA